MDKTRIEAIITNLITIKARNEELIEHIKMNNQIVEDTISIFNYELDRNSNEPDQKSDDSIKLEDNIDSILKAVDDAIAKLRE